MRLAMPDSACRGIEVESAQSGHTTAYRGQIVDVDNPRHLRALRAEGAFPVNLGGRPSGGYRCPECGFAAFIATCGRCGSQCVKE